jgi:hypothetical protein
MLSEAPWLDDDGRGLIFGDAIRAWRGWRWALIAICYNGKSHPHCCGIHTSPDDCAREFAFPD